MSSLTIDICEYGNCSEVKKLNCMKVIYVYCSVVWIDPFELEPWKIVSEYTFHLH